MIGKTPRMAIILSIADQYQVKVGDIIRVSANPNVLKAIQQIDESTFNETTSYIRRLREAIAAYNEIPATPANRAADEYLQFNQKYAAWVPILRPYPHICPTPDQNLAEQTRVDHITSGDLPRILKEFPWIDSKFIRDHIEETRKRLASMAKESGERNPL